MSHSVFVKIVQKDNYQFTNQYSGSFEPIISDEPPPLGTGLGPSPVELLCSAVGNCLCASLLFACRKFKIDPGAISCDIHAEIGRNAQARTRVLEMRVVITSHQLDLNLQFADKVLEQFEDFCTVTQSVRGSIPVHVQVLNNASAVIHESK